MADGKETDDGAVREEAARKTASSCEEASVPAAGEDGQKSAGSSDSSENCDGDTAEPDESAPRVTMRVLAKGADSEDQKFWVERLKECGAEVIDAGRGGIVAEGPVPAFEKALEISMEMEGDKPVMKAETAIRSSEKADPPVAYIPSKPTMFP